MAVTVVTVVYTDTYQNPEMIREKYKAKYQATQN
jgi:hypothetical protein